MAAMIDLTFAVADKCGRHFLVRPSAITFIEASETNEKSGCILTVGGQRVAVVESMQTVHQRMQTAESG